MFDDRTTNLKIDARDLLLSLPRKIVVIGRDLTFLDANDAYFELTGRRREDLVGRPVFELFPMDPASSDFFVRDSFLRVIETGRPEVLDAYYYPIRSHPSDEVLEHRWWRAENRPILQDGTVVALIHDVEDVTADVIARRDRDVRDRLIGNLSRVATWEFRPREGRIVASAALAEMFELEDQAGGGPAAPYFGRVHPEDVARLTDAFEAGAEAEAGTPVEIDFRIVTPVAGERWLTCRSEVVRADSKAPANFIGLSLDITESKAREAALTETVAERNRLLKQKEILLGEVNHRIKNSLQIVSSILKLDANQAKDGLMQGRLRAASSRVQAVASVHELIYRAGQVDTVEFGEYLGDLCRAMEDSLPPDIALIHKSVPLRVSTDRAISLALLVNELVANSVAHAFQNRKDGTIAVKATIRDAHLELSVSDDGDGKADRPGHRGLGTRIIAAMVAQLEADVQQFQGARGGHVVRISMPIDR